MGSVEAAEKKYDDLRNRLDFEYQRKVSLWVRRILHRVFTNTADVWLIA